MKRLLTQILLIIVCLSAAAQVHYPIRTFTILNPPLPYTLSGFAGEPGRMMLNINVDDISLDQYAVKFRLNIQGNGIRLYTKPTMHQEPFFMDGGINESFTGMDLEQFFNPDNLIFEGYSRNEYKRNGRLPEGVYRISVDVLDYYRGFNVSQATPGMAMIYLTRAPRLTFPATQTEVDPGGVPNIRFSWLATLPADPLTDVAYRFRLWEIRPAGRDPYEMVQVSAPVFSEEVDAANFIYDISRPPLIDGMWYAWQVQAFDREGRALFKNDGKSEVFSFRYGKSCVIPEPVITGVGHTEVSLRWSGDGSVQLYRLFYKRTDDSDWQQAETGSLTYKLEGLDDNTGYELKVQAICSDSESDFSRVMQFKTNRVVDYTCGANGDEFDLSNREPLPALGRFDEFKAADFVIEVEEAEGANGLFSGKGMALVPYLGFIKFYVTFENVFINTDHRMVDGEVEFVYDEATGMVIGIGGGTRDKKEDEPVDIRESLGQITDKTVEVDGEVTDVVVENNTVIITRKDGSTQRVKVKKGEKVGVVSSGGQTVHVVDQGSGRVYTTPKKPAGGKKGSKSVGTAAQTGQYGCTTTFLPAKNQRYGFDAVGDGNTKPDAYFKRSKSQDLIHWKSLGAGTTDFVDLSIQGAVSPDSLRYLRESGVLTPVAPSGKNQRLLLTGLAGGEEDILTVALATSEKVNDSTKREKLTETGALGIVTYDRIARDVVLVPVNGAQCPNGKSAAQEITTALNKIYAPAIVDWQVSIDKNLEVTKLSSDGFKVEGTGMLSKYTKDMDRVIKTFKKERDHDKNTLYLFLVQVPNATRTGFMPLAAPYGFIFNFGSDLNVLAHELAHGTFNLRHTFSDKAQYHFPERTTKNLMDYANGTELWKYQWDLIHNPEKITFAWAQNEDEGAMTNVLRFINYEDEQITLFNEILVSGNVTYVTPSGKPFSLPVGYEPTFSGAINGIEANSSLNIPRGVLFGFKDTQGNNWLANFTNPSNGAITFNGYKNEREYKKITQPGGEKYPVIVGIENDNCRLEVYYSSLQYSLSKTSDYSGAGKIINGDKIALADDALLAKSITLSNGCTPDHWLELPAIDYENFTNNVSARYDVYGKGGVLCKLSSGHYYYSNLDDQGEVFYMMWNEPGKRWELWTPPDPTCLSCELRELLTYRSIFLLLKESGHDALDAVGLIPFLGEWADGINSLWYFLEGDYGNASLSGFSIIPVIGDVTGKSLKLITKVDDAVEVVEISGEALTVFNKVGRKLGDGAATINDLEGTFRTLGKLLDNTEEVIKEVDYLTQGMNPEAIQKFLAKINTFDEAKRAECITDLAQALRQADGNVTCGPDELVEAWEKLSEFPVAIRRNLDNLNQRRILDEYADGIASASSARKGNFGEIGADLDLNTKGYESLQIRLKDIDAPGHNGIDGIYRKNGEFFIVEGKYTGSASLKSANKKTGLPRQMSDDWIRRPGEMEKALGPGNEILARSILRSDYKRILAKVAPDGSVTYRLVDSQGKVIRGNAGIFNP